MDVEIIEVKDAVEGRVVDDTIKLKQSAPVSSRRRSWKRGLQGVGLCFMIFIMVLSLPLMLLGCLLRLLGRLLTQPCLALFTKKIVPKFVVLAYIHRIGKLHPILSIKWRKSKQRTPHSRPIRIDLRSSHRQLISIHTIAQLSDNFAYLIVNRSTPNLASVVVDCAHAESLIDICNGIANVHYAGQTPHIEAILTTHHHWDHMAGNPDLTTRLGSIKNVYAGKFDRVIKCNQYLSDQQFFIEANITFQAIHTPCHTKGHIVYRLKGENRRDCLFLGDTLFHGGCGANFEGTQHQMHKNFAKILLTSHPDTILFPAHEYTERILMDAFPTKAAHYANHDPYRFFSLCSALCRAQHLRSLPFPAPTVGIRLKEEVAYNHNFEPALRGSLLLKDLLLSSRPQSSAGISKRLSSNWECFDSHLVPNALMELHPSPTVTSATIGRGESYADFVRPHITMEDHGQLVIVEPPWIMDNVPSNPFIINWKEDVAELVTKMEKSNANIAKSLVIGKLNQWRNEMPLRGSWPLKRGYGIRDPLMHNWPRTLKDVIECIECLSEDAENHYVTMERLEAAVTQTYDQEAGASFPDIDRLRKMWRRDSKDRISVADIVDSLHRHLRRKELMKIGRETDGSVVKEKQEGMAREYDDGRRSIHVHDFTECRICQGQAVKRGGSSSRSLLRPGTMYSNSRAGLTTIITAGCSSERPSEGRSLRLMSGDFSLSPQDGIDISSPTNYVSLTTVSSINNGNSFLGTS